MLMGYLHIHLGYLNKLLGYHNPATSVLVTGDATPEADEWKWVNIGDDGIFFWVTEKDKKPGHYPVPGRIIPIQIYYPFAQG